MKNRGFMYFYMVLYEDWGFISDIGERIGHSPLRGRYHGGLASKNDNLPAENGVRSHRITEVEVVEEKWCKIA